MSELHHHRAEDFAAGIDELLEDPRLTSVRLVTNPEKMVLRETQRAFVYFSLHGLTVDSIIVNRPIEEVFAYVTDIERFPEWTSFVRRAEKTSDGPVGLATTLRTDLQFLGRQFTSEQVITEFVPNRVFAGKSMLESQRLVLGAIKHLLAGERAPVHAVDSLTTRTP